MLRRWKTSAKDLQRLWLFVVLILVLVMLAREHTLLMSSMCQPALQPLPQSKPHFIDDSFSQSGNSLGNRHQHILYQDNLLSNKWIVLDDMTSECLDEDVIAFTKISGWNVLIVSPLASLTVFQAKRCRRPSCIWLNERTYHQLLHGFASTNLVPKPTKLSGYLLAMTYGARVIVDAKCLPSSSPSRINRHPFWMYPHLPFFSLFYNASGVFNPFQHFGYQTLYPGTFYNFLNMNKNEAMFSSRANIRTDCNFYTNGCSWYHSNSNMYFIKDHLKVNTIWQSVSPSYAWIHTDRNNIIKKSSTLGREFFPDSSSRQFVSPVAVGGNMLAPLDTGFTLFPMEQFSLLFLPAISSMTKEQQVLFRTLFINGIRSHRNFPINYIYTKLDIFNSFNNIISNVDSNKGTGRNNLSSVHTLLNKTMGFSKKYLVCNKDSASYNLSECAVHLVVAIMKWITGNEDTAVECANINVCRQAIVLFKAWMEDLHTLELNPFYNHTRDQQAKETNVFKLKYSFHIDPLVTIDSKTSHFDTISKRIFNPWNEVCANFSSTTLLSPKNWKYPFIHDIVLVIVINYESLFETLPYLEYIHRSSFRYIVYCGPNAEKFHSFADKNGFSYLTFIDGFTHSWYFMYECVTHTMKLNLPVKGYLQIGEDVLLNIRKLMRFPRDRIWMPKGFTHSRLNQSISPEGWSHWTTKFGRSAIQDTFKELDVIAAGRKNIGGMDFHGDDSKEDYNLYFRQREFASVFINNYDQNIGRENVLHRAIDIFFIPEILRDEYIFVSEIFRRHRTMIELAVPIMHLGFVPKSEVIYIAGASLWRKERYQPWKFYHENSTHFIHPFKSLYHLKQREGREFFCQKYLRTLND